jgi:integrase
VKTPDVTALQFAALSELLDGQVHRNSSLARSVGNHRPESFVLVLKALERRGLLERVRWAAVCGARPAGTGYRVTAQGRRAWAETLDYFLFFAKRSGDRGSLSTRAPRLKAIASAPFPASASAPERRPNGAEVQAIAAAASRELACLLSAMECGVLDFAELIRMRIEDIDFAEGTARVGRGPRRTRAVELGAELLKAAKESTGSRAAGSVFVNHYGQPWTRSSAAHAFCKARAAAGVDRRAKLLGRLSRRRDSIER